MAATIGVVGNHGNHGVLRASGGIRGTERTWGSQHGGPSNLGCQQEVGRTPKIGDLGSTWGMRPSNMADTIGVVGNHGNQRDLWASGGTQETEWDRGDMGGSTWGYPKFGVAGGGGKDPKNWRFGVQMGDEA